MEIALTSDISLDVKDRAANTERVSYLRASK